ncbi:MAG: hypothetical protein ACYCST_09960 [Acidimicrobiales bacterium]
MSSFVVWYLPLIREVLHRLPPTFWAVMGVGEGALYYKIGRAVVRRRKSRHERVASGMGAMGR